jgi:hypothetical protein
VCGFGVLEHDGARRGKSISPQVHEEIMRRGRKMIRIVATSALLVLTGCASIVGGTSQKIAIETRKDDSGVPGALCRLSNGKGIWYLTTPGAVSVHRAYAPLEIRCQKAGEQNGTATIQSKTKGLAFGNAVFGGVIGAGIDMADGAAYEYPEEITVYMGSPPFKPGPASTQGTTTGPATVASVLIANSPQQAEVVSNEAYRRNTSAGTPVIIASHGEWDHWCRPRALPTITIVNPPEHGRIEVTEGDFVIGHSRKSTDCVGRTTHGDTVVYIPEDGFHGIDHVSYQVAFPHAADVHIAEITVR